MSTNVHPVNTPPDTGQRERDGRSGHAEHRALTQRQEVEDRDREGNVREQENPSVAGNVRALIATLKVAYQTAFDGTIKLNGRQTLECH